MKTKEQQAEYDKRRYADPAFREARKRRSRKWYATNREKVLARSRARRVTNHPVAVSNRAKLREKYHADPALASTARRARRLQERYGLTQKQYDTMMEIQGHVCVICKKPPKVGGRRLDVDHDHGPSKRVRGLACFSCNKYRIGMNTVETARRVWDYLASDFDGRTLGDESKCQNFWRLTT